ncbi:MAG TPA: SUMF1/EgtB/PvdO family nonheme iron enzyme [Anaerolineales bacterium]|nr:SUMF1/EgtB/PvdO family nonheme iron enzyme [Anaerolineales bacterium]
MFLCYSSEDKFIVHDFYRRLSTETWIDPWFDEERIFPGMNRDVEIKRAVETADAVVVCLSHNSVNKEGEIQRELHLVVDAALEKPEGAIFVIPLKLDECQIPRSMRSLQCIDFSSPDDRKQAYNRLLKSLEIKADMVIRPPGNSQSAHFVSPQHIEPEFDFVPLASCGFDFVKIPQGKFIIGSKASNSQAREDEIPQFPYTIPYDYWINRFPISNEQFSEFAVSTKRLGALPKDWRQKLHHPIVNVSLHDALAYIHWLNKVFGREIPMGLTFRLPTEAEWERASRGDSAWEWPWGNKNLDEMLEEQISPRTNSVPGEANHSETKTNSHTPEHKRNCRRLKIKAEILRRTLEMTDVGAFSPLTDSPFKVADMMGSVLEWTQSLYASYPYDAQDGRENLETEGKRVIRGCFTSNEERLSVRSARRGSAEPERKDSILGFRIVIAPPVL